MFAYAHDPRVVQEGDRYRLPTPPEYPDWLVTEEYGNWHAYPENGESSGIWNSTAERAIADVIGEPFVA